MKSMRTQWTGVALIVIVGLVNLHIPHFLLETKNDYGSAECPVELALLVNFGTSLVAALGIARSMRWGWVTGTVACVFSAVLWLAQETVGLPGLPQHWLEPSRIAALAIGAVFVFMACRF